MVIDATRQFQCNHEYVALPGVPVLVCHRCDLHRAELPIPGRPSLLFFPTSVREMEAERSKVVNG